MNIKQIMMLLLITGILGLVVDLCDMCKFGIDRDIGVLMSVIIIGIFQRPFFKVSL